MANAIQKLFRVEQGEGKLIFVLGVTLLANALAMQISGIVGVSGFLDSGGVNQLLLVLFIDYALILAVGSLQSLIIDKFDRITLIQWAALLFAVFFVVLRLMFLFQAPDWLNYSAMFILSEQQFVVFPLIFWVLANDIFRLSQAKRLFPVISGFNFAGKLIGIGVAASAPAVFENLGIVSEDILVVNILVYLLAYILLLLGLRKVEVRKVVQQTESLKETIKEGWAFIRDVPAFNYMMYVLIALAVADTIIEFQFYVITDRAFLTLGEYQTFFSFYRLGTTLVALLLQSFVTSYLIKQMQLKNTFFFFPIVAFIAALGMVFVPGLGMAIGGMAAVKLVRDTIHESGRKSFQGLIPEERRGRVSNLMETYFPAFGTMLGCVLAGIVVWVGIMMSIEVSWYYMGIAALGGAFAIWAVTRVYYTYDASLLNWRLKRRQRRANTVLLEKLEKK